MSKKQRKPDKDILPIGEGGEIDAGSGDSSDAVSKCQTGPHPSARGGPPARAEHFMFLAESASDKERQVRLARKALEIWPDCAEAYTFLAKQTRNRTESLHFYEQGVAAGARALEAVGFSLERDGVCGVPQTWAYLRARIGLAQTLRYFGRLDEAVQHLRDLLRLDPDDYHRARYPLASALLILGCNDELAELLRRFRNDKTTAWAYTKAILCFRRNGDTSEARYLLRQARKTNKYVPRYLLTDKSLPISDARKHWRGDPGEAVYYVERFGRGWKTTAGAFDWLRDNIKKKARPSRIGPVAAVKLQLINDLPQAYDVWQADFRPLPARVRVGDEVVRCWVILVTSRSNELLLAYEVETEPPSAACLWDVLVQAMQNPSEGEAHRPSELQVRPDARWESMAADLDDIDVGLVVAEELDYLQEIHRGAADEVAGRPRPGLLEMPGITPEQVGSYYAAAARFFQLAPWIGFASRTAIKIECRNFESGPWYAVPMGRSGLGVGLGLCESWNLLQRLWTCDRREAWRWSLEAAGLAVFFEEEGDVAVADVDASRKYGWDLARSDAYPMIMRKEPGLSTRRPLAWELELVEGCLRAIPDFRERREDDDPTQEEMIVPVASGHLRMVLSWATSGAS